ncbi:MAG: tetratricopeptide repeat protein, partial [Desulfobulbaceae bacterium]|nr:tetratricopeptide repeat protein [Desulfobulbaceae bacterium]
MIWLGICLLWLCSACTGGFRTNQEQQSDDCFSSCNESVDTACSYFYYLWGTSTEHERRYDEAVEAYEKALVCDVTAKHVMWKLAVLLVKTDRKQQAMEWVREIISIDPNDIKARILLARLYSAVGEIKSAVEVAESILDIESCNVSALLMLSSLYVQKGEYGEAEKVLKSLVKSKTDAYLGYHYLSILYRELRYFDKALDAIKEALALNWSVSLALDAGELLEYLEHHEQAIEMYRRILEDDVDNKRARLRLAAVLEFLERYDEAMKLYQYLLDDDQHDDIARRRLISILLKTDESDRAVEELKELREYTKEVRKVDFTIGRIYLETGRHDEAVELFSRMVKDDPELETAHYLLALAQYENGNRGEAEKLLKKIKPSGEVYEDSVLLRARMMQDENDFSGAEGLLKENIENEDARELSFYVVLASLYVKQEKLELANDLFKEAIAKFPDNPKVFFEYGMLLDRIGEMDGAVESMEKVLALTPEDPFALNYVGYVWADKGINLDTALRYIKKAVVLRPTDGFIRDSLGWVYFKRGDFEKAASELEKAVEIEPDD